jgi:hypothetical protein
MSLFDTKVRFIIVNERFSKYAYAIVIDSMDLIPNIINSLLNFIGIGVVLDFGVDGIQTTAALLLFKDPVFAITNVDLIMPSPFDVFPAYTSKLLYHDIIEKKK